MGVHSILSVSSGAFLPLVMFGLVSMRSKGDGQRHLRGIYDGESRSDGAYPPRMRPSFRGVGDLCPSGIAG